MSDLTIEQGARIGFSANKTKEQAIQDSNSNRMTICKSHELYMNGRRLGLSENEASYLERKVQEEYDAKAGFSVTCTPNVLDAAAPAPVTITVRTTWNGILTDADTVPTVNYKNGGGPVITVQLAKSSTGVYNGTINNLNKGVQLNCSATIKGVNKSAAPFINAYHKIRFGVSSQETLSNIPEDFKSKGPQQSAWGTYTFSFKPNTYGFILVPNGVALPGSMQGDHPSGVEGPLPVPFIKQAYLVVNGVTYTVLRIADMQAESLHNVDFH